MNPYPGHPEYERRKKHFVFWGGLIGIALSAVVILIGFIWLLDWLSRP